MPQRTELAPVAFANSLMRMLQRSLDIHISVNVWGFIPKFSAYEETKGTYLEAAEEFTIALPGCIKRSVLPAQRGDWLEGDLRLS